MNFSREFTATATFLVNIFPADHGARTLYEGRRHLQPFCQELSQILLSSGSVNQGRSPLNLVLLSVVPKVEPQESSEDKRRRNTRAKYLVTFQQGWGKANFCYGPETSSPRECTFMEFTYSVLSASTSHHLNQYRKVLVKFPSHFYRGNRSHQHGIKLYFTQRRAMK